mmetsp:Transcript_3858/g.6589  ORF Transcript_3858/g.6589 Transcript_3858/m.6589 type:complete len:222 (-) Transcript_3858:88-753(-)
MCCTATPMFSCCVLVWRISSTILTQELPLIPLRIPARNGGICVSRTNAVVAMEAFRCGASRMWCVPLSFAGFPLNLPTCRRIRGMLLACNPWETETGCPIPSWLIVSLWEISATWMTPLPSTVHGIRANPPPAPMPLFYPNSFEIRTEHSTLDKNTVPRESTSIITITTTTRLSWIHLLVLLDGSITNSMARQRADCIPALINCQIQYLLTRLLHKIKRRR